MRQLWSDSKDDNTLRDFWSSLPKNSTTQKIQRIQDENLVKNIKRLNSRDDALSQTMDAGLIEAARSHIGPGTRLSSAASPVQNRNVSPTDIPPKPFSIDQDKAPTLVSDDEEDEDEEEHDTSVRPPSTTEIITSSSSSPSSSASSIMKRKNPNMEGNPPQTVKKTTRAHDTSRRKENKKVQSLAVSHNERPRVVGSPSPLPKKLPTSTPEGLHNISDIVFDAVITDLPSLANESNEITELTSLLGDVCTYEAFQDRVFNIAPNTPIRRFLFRILDAYSRYFPKHKDIPRLLERQAMFDLLCPFIRGALLVYDVKSDISEIPILGSGIRRNIGKEESDKLSRCLLADITGDDSAGNQVFLAECSKVYEKDVRKFQEDRRKLARAMKDSWDLAVRKLAEGHSRPHAGLCVYGLQFFDEKIDFFKLDYRGHYRLWLIDSAQLPMHHDNFFQKTAACSKLALKFAAAIAREIDERNKLETISPTGALTLLRAARGFKRTTAS
ncbi:hypothetical protein BGX27_008795 [Mortierella sp. AM989]|nr:hypothetical protein BGX27_008795 [Mortierella sp. AM989]